ncbi:MAG: hypothetical protein LZF62_410054 [Nitrospira sp.]|nr:MAG: hypothetical protein LZF62_410054 [Nitrospira sp.]
MNVCPLQYVGTALALSVGRKEVNAMSTLSGRQTMHPSQKKSSTRRACDTGPMTSLADIDSERTRVRAMLQEIIEGPTAILQSVGGDHVTKSSAMTIPVGYVPTPTREYRQHRKLLRAATGIVSRSSIRIIPDREIGRIPVPAPIPFPRIKGSRVLMWKQDPSVSESAFGRPTSAAWCGPDPETAASPFRAHRWCPLMPWRISSKPPAHRSSMRYIRLRSSARC